MARAFNQECTVRCVNVDADGDEIMSGDARGELANGEDTGLVLSEDILQQIEVGPVSLIPKAFALIMHCLMRGVRNPPQDFVRESR